MMEHAMVAHVIINGTSDDGTHDDGTYKFCCPSTILTGLNLRRLAQWPLSFPFSPRVLVHLGCLSMSSHTTTNTNSDQSGCALVGLLKTPFQIISTVFLRYSFLVTVLLRKKNLFDCSCCQEFLFYNKMTSHLKAHFCPTGRNREQEISS